MNYGENFGTVRVDYTVYTCNNCGKVYGRNNLHTVRCAVAHGPRDCCHYGEDGPWDPDRREAQ